MEKLSFILSPAIDGEFEVVNTHLPILRNTKIGDVDLRRITLSQANELIEKGTRYLKRIEKKEEAKPISKKASKKDVL